MTWQTHTKAIKGQREEPLGREPSGASDSHTAGRDSLKSSHSHGTSQDSDSITKKYEEYSVWICAFLKILRILAYLLIGLCVNVCDRDFVCLWRFDPLVKNAIISFQNRSWGNRVISSGDRFDLTNEQPWLQCRFSLSVAFAIQLRCLQLFGLKGSYVLYLWHYFIINMNCYEMIWIVDHKITNAYFLLCIAPIFQVTMFEIRSSPWCRSGLHQSPWIYPQFVVTAEGHWTILHPCLESKTQSMGYGKQKPFGSDMSWE